MEERNYHLHNGKKGVALALRVTPRAKENQIAEILEDGTIRIRLTTPPEDHKINEMLPKFLSGILGVPEAKVEIIAGHEGREKLVSILDVDAEIVHQTILRRLSK